MYQLPRLGGGGGGEERCFRLLVININTDFKNATPRLNLNIFRIENSIVINLVYYTVLSLYNSVFPEYFIVIGQV